jgi:long-chain acyl-CoA synthetase
MERPWLRHYPQGIAAEIDTARIPSLVAILEESFKAHAARPACICMGATLTYAELDRASWALAAWLQARGLERGARVAVMMPNLPQYPVAIAAILRAGFTVVNVNPLYKPRELEFQLSDAGAEAIIVIENFASVLQEALPRTPVKHVIVASMGDMLGTLRGLLVNGAVRHIKKMVPPFSLPGSTRFNDALAQGRRLPFTPASPGPDDLAFLQYTGGTTGVAKGAMLLHRNLVANVLQVEAWHRPLLDVPPAVDRLLIVTALPLYHIFALTGCFLFGMRTGGTCLLIPNPRDIPGLIKELCRYKVNMFPAVNTLYNALLNHPDFGKIDWNLLKSAVAGGMAVQRPVAEAWIKATGRPIIEGYGLSETSPVLTCNRGDIAEWTGTIGFPLPSTDLSIRDDDGHEVPAGAPGEICARGPQVMPGYWRRPEETAKVMTADGFFRTGDIGVMDESGRVRIVDRKKDMISVSGFKVFPNEVEELAMSQGGILECAVVGVPDKHSGEVPKLFAVKKNPDLTEAALRAFLASQLAGYKVPRHIEFRSELPKTPVGKILRRALRDEAMGKTMNASDIKPADVIAFWRGIGPKGWFEKNATVDEDIRSRFLALHETAAAGKLSAWEQHAEGALALLILLDQFPRNMFRGQARAFATDPLARALAATAIVRGFDAQTAPDMRTFFYLPFEHSEDMADQERAVAFCKAAGDADGLKWAEVHADIIRRFGRFPHRNAVLGRATTPEEQAFLDSGGFAG